MNRNPVTVLRQVAIVEAISFLVLVLIAMPLKYFAGSPMAVRVVGLIHGVLFVFFLIAWVWTIVTARWPAGRAAVVLVSALLPFGPFVIDRRMRQWESESAPLVAQR